MIDNLEYALSTFSDGEKEKVMSLLEASSFGSESRKSLSMAISLLAATQAQMGKGAQLTEFQEVISKLKKRQREFDEQWWPRMQAAQERTAAALAELAEIAKSTEESLQDERILFKDLEGDQTTTELKHELATAVQEYMKESSILTVNYKWKRQFEGFIDDTDGIVVGVIDGVETVVLCQAKLNMEKNWEDAVWQADGSWARWERLCEIYDEIEEADPDSIDTDDMKDIESLNISEHKSKQVLIALGGQHFPVSLCFKISKRMGKTGTGNWLYVHMNGADARIELRS